ncbi:MAG: TIM-barrel domain-containing protein [Tannerellaceae bacterium]
MKHISLMSGLCVAISLLCSCNMNTNRDQQRGNPNWDAEFPGVWKATIAEPEEINLLNTAHALPVADRLKRKSTTNFPIDKSEITYFVKDGKTFLRFPLEKDEQIYGLGLNFQSVNQRGQSKRLHMDHYGNSDNGRTHAPVPFFVSSKGYGVLFNSARYIDVQVGVGVRTDSKNPAIPSDRNTDPAWNPQPYSDNLEVLIPAEGAEVVLFSGDNMLDVISRFNLYCGSGFIPPKWGLGFWHRTPTLFSDQDVKKEADAFKEKGFPLDVVGLEPGWHSLAYPCSFEWDESRFPDPAKFVDQMNNDGIKVNLWCNPYIAEQTTLHDQLKPYSGTHTVWCGIVPDYTMEKPRKLFKDHIRKHQLDYGVTGYKMDEVDGFDCWLWNEFAEFPSGTSGEQMRSIYGNLMMDMLDEAYREKNERTYGLIRAVNAGGVRFPYVIYNDNYSHRDFITAVINSGFIGVMWTPEVRAGKSSEEWVRRMQTTCFAPIAMINAWADGTKPWSFPEVYDECKEAALLRMQLLPYLYSTFSQYYTEGIPPFRAMNLIEGFDGKVKKEKGKLDATDNPYEMVTVHEVKDQYLVGDNILVAPVFAGETERNVVLPQGNWYDFYTGKLVGNGTIVTIPAQLNRLPLFVKDGGIVPMIPPVRQTSEWISGQPLEMRVYGSADGSFDLYDDDGVSYDYTKGKQSLRRFAVSNGLPSIEVVEDNGGWTYKDVNWKFMSK